MIIKTTLIVIVFALILSYGAYADATDWVVFAVVGAETGTTVTNAAAQNFYGVTTTATDALDIEDYRGAPVVSNCAYIRDYGFGATSTNYGLTGDMRAAFTSGSKTWSTLIIGAQPNFTATSLGLRLWSMYLAGTTDTPDISFKVTSGVAETDYTTGTVLISKWDKTKDSGNRSEPAYYFDFTSLIPYFVAGNTITLEMTASYVPEPGSMVAMLSGIVCLAGFVVHRMK